MNTTLLYPLVLFLHILGAFGLVAAITLEAIGLRGLRRAVRSEDALMWLGISRGLVLRLAPASLGLILVTGLWMTATAWGPKGWILVALASLVLLALVGALGTGIRMARLGPAIGRANGPLTDELKAALRDPVLLTSIRTRVALVLGIVFLMTVKPSAVASLVVIAVAAAIGLLAGQIPFRRSRNELRADVG
jgi:hypothetical protein